MNKKVLSFTILGAVLATTVVMGGKYIKSKLNVIPADVSLNNNFSQTSTGTFSNDAQGNSQALTTDISLTPETNIITDTNNTMDDSSSISQNNMYLSNELAEKRYPYQQLSKEEQAIYTALFNSVQNLNETVTFPFAVDADTYKKIYTLFYREEAQFFYLNNSYHYSEKPTDTINISYLYTSEQIKSMQAQIDSKIQPIMQDINAASSEYEKFVLMHDFIVSNCSYSLDEVEVNTIYGCLVNGRAGCEGYAKSIIYMAKKAGLNAMLISGITREGEHHAWNIVQIDGEYYNMDTTWDDPLVSANDTSGITSNWHFYCLIPDDGFLNVTHFPETNVFNPPSCNSINNSYYTKQSSVPISYDNAKDIIKTQLISAVSANKQFIELKFTDGDVYNETKEKLFTNQELFSILNEVNLQCGGKINATRFSQQTSNELQTIFIGIIYN